jgi:cytochrome oxidase Cu insertion factor (SCO1/SenC/PrrC family)
MKKHLKPTLVMALVAVIAAVSAAACSSSPATPAATVTSIAADTGVSSQAVSTPVVDASFPDDPDVPLAPDFTLTSATGQPVSLADLLEGRDATVIVFYRGFF